MKFRKKKSADYRQRMIKFWENQLKATCKIEGIAKKYHIPKLLEDIIIKFIVKVLYEVLKFFLF